MRRFCYGIFVHLSWSYDDLFCVTCSRMYTSRDYDGWKTRWCKYKSSDCLSVHPSNILLFWEMVISTEKRKERDEEMRYVPRIWAPNTIPPWWKQWHKKSHHTIINNNHDSTCNFFFKRSSIVSVFPFFFFKICLKDIVAGTSSNNKKLYDKCQGWQNGWF